MLSNIKTVLSSYHRARSSGGFFDSFYSIFLDQSPEIRLMFAHTDFKHQKLMLRESMLEMLAYCQTGAGLEEIQRLAKQHIELCVKPEHYELWLTSLCEALAIHDPQFTSELEQQWRTSMRPGIDVMIGAEPPEV